MKIYKYRNQAGNCHHKSNNHTQSKDKMWCTEDKCRYYKECYVEVKNET